LPGWSLSRKDFTFDEDRNVYVCPETLEPTRACRKANLFVPIWWGSSRSVNQRCRSASHFVMASVRGCSFPSK
jgi:hypothetical protein